MTWRTRVALGRRAVTVAAFLLCAAAVCVHARDLPEIMREGVLRHLGVPYANFVTGSGDGLDVELVRSFAEHLGVRYEYVESSWENLIGDLSGQKFEIRGDGVEFSGEVAVRGDMVANGLTILPWREQIIDFSTPTFPTQVWLIARSDSPIRPVAPSGDTEKDIAVVKAQLKGHKLLGKARTSLDPFLYSLEQTGAKIYLFGGALNDLVPAIIVGGIELTLLDLPDALLALDKWPGDIKVIGPVSRGQRMAYGFAKTSPELKSAFNRFFDQCKADGTYLRLVKKYYPVVYKYYSEFFEHQQAKR